LPREVLGRIDETCTVHRRASIAAVQSRAANVVCFHSSGASAHALPHAPGALGTSRMPKSPGTAAAIRTVDPMAHEDTLQTGLEHQPAANDTPNAEQAQTPQPRRLTGFALMNAERRKAIASQGGKAAHARGTAHRFDSSTASAAGRRAHERGTAHVWTPEAAREAGRKGGRAPRKPRISGSQTNLTSVATSGPTSAVG